MNTLKKMYQRNDGRKTDLEKMISEAEAEKKRQTRAEEARIRAITRNRNLQKLEKMNVADMTYKEVTLLDSLRKQKEEDSYDFMGQDEMVTPQTLSDGFEKLLETLNDIKSMIAENTSKMQEVFGQQFPEKFATFSNAMEKCVRVAKSRNEGNLRKDVFPKQPLMEFETARKELFSVLQNPDQIYGYDSGRQVKATSMGTFAPDTGAYDKIIARYLEFDVEDDLEGIDVQKGSKLRLHSCGKWEVNPKN